MSRYNWRRLQEALICFLLQDNYTFAQPGIQMKVNALKELIQRIDGECPSFSRFFLIVFIRHF